ncbi:MAG: hypothetical protein GXO30_08045, partial [Epsilonproteobacteria bacterium]|nr:hypothetical protein [Campylobacterota bacterium]
MIKIFKIILITLLIFLFNGCLSTPNTPKQISPSKKTFADEDSYILFALRAEELKDYTTASKMFTTLWNKSNKKEYLYRSFQDELLAHNYNDVLKRVEIYITKTPNDIKLLRIKTFALLGLKEYKKAKIVAIKLVKQTKSIDDHILIAEIYEKQNKYNQAVKYLDNIYKKDYNEKILDKLAVILYVKLNKKEDAIHYLQTHIKINSCSESICRRLLAFYANQNDVDGILSMYLRLYELKKSDEIAKRIIQIYNYKKEFLKLMTFLEKSSSNDEVLLQIYINFKNYKKASKLAQKLYEESGEIEKLGQSAI